MDNNYLRPTLVKGTSRYMILASRVERTCYEGIDSLRVYYLESYKAKAGGISRYHTCHFLNVSSLK